MDVPNHHIGKYLLSNNIKPSYPRIKVMEYLITNKSHPTVDEIYNELIKDIPTLSKTTVYNTLDIFIRASIVRVLLIEDNETRYDSDVSEHGHFKCENCRQVVDFSIHLNKLKTRDLDNFNIKEKHVYFIGICSKCLNNKKN